MYKKFQYGENFSIYTNVHLHVHVHVAPSTIKIMEDIINHLYSPKFVLSKFFPCSLLTSKGSMSFHFNLLTSPHAQQVQHKTGKITGKTIGPNMYTQNSMANMCSTITFIHVVVLHLQPTVHVRVATLMVQQAQKPSHQPISRGGKKQICENFSTVSSYCLCEQLVSV